MVPKKKRVRLTPMQRAAKGQVNKLLEGATDVVFPLPEVANLPFLRAQELPIVPRGKARLSVDELLAGSQEVDILPDGRLVPRGRGRTKERLGVVLDAHTFYLEGSLKEINHTLVPRSIRILPDGQLVLTAQRMGLLMLDHSFP